jgi:hypothetical protein
MLQLARQSRKAYKAPTAGNADLVRLLSRSRFPFMPEMYRRSCIRINSSPPRSRSSQHSIRILPPRRNSSRVRLDCYRKGSAHILLGLPILLHLFLRASGEGG